MAQDLKDLEIMLIGIDLGLATLFGGNDEAMRGWLEAPRFQPGGLSAIELMSVAMQEVVDVLDEARGLG